MNNLNEQEEVVLKVTWVPLPGRKSFIRQENRDGRFLYEGRGLAVEARAAIKQHCEAGSRYYLAKHEGGIPFFKINEPLSDLALSLVGGGWDEFKDKSDEIGRASCRERV